MIYDTATREAAARAADWLEANPDKHITGTAVTTINGHNLQNPNAKSAACFCAIGRLAKEAGLTKVEIEGCYTFVNRMLNSERRTDRLWSRNDRHKPDGIAALREVAADKEIAP